ncbi:MAG: FtsB family cell division protein [Pseudomonadota bacterium]
MGLWGELKRRAKDAIGPVLGFCVVGYFAYHSVEGERGLGAYIRLSERIAEARAHLEDVTAERKALARRVGLLRSDNLDPDLMEERARLILNLARPDEVVILDPVPGGATR